MLNHRAVWSLSFMALRSILLIAAAHFAFSLASAFAAEGWDLDQLRSRSQFSQAAGVLHDVLMYPHDAAMRALPNAWLAGNTPLIPLAVIVSSLLWGAVLYGAWRVLNRTSPKPPTCSARTV
jgi:hypothetical protein